MKMIICKLSVDIMQKQMHSEFTEIIASENKNSFFSDQFLNMDISVDIPHITSKFKMCIYETLMEGCVSQNFYLGPSFHLMKCRNLYYKKMQNVTRFFLHKMKSKA